MGVSRSTTSSLKIVTIDDYSVVPVSLALSLLLSLTPVERAIQYLGKEVPAWRAANGCFSCHNNGDGARALLAAKQPLDPATEAWLTNPALWDTNKGDPAFSDKKLARIQFAAALMRIPERPNLCTAAALISKDQSPDGSWQVDSGSPATYGTALATYFARETQIACNLDSTRATLWLNQLKPQSILEAAAQLLAFPSHQAAKSYLAKAQNPDGGFGEYPQSPSQVFDTAIAIIALGSNEPARQWLIRQQQPEGGWQETTRPPGAQSYAQHISTTAWALLALL